MCDEQEKEKAKRKCKKRKVREQFKTRDR